MAQAVAYSASDEKMHESEPEPEIDGVDPWKAAMQGDLDALLQYIDDNGDVNQRDRDNNTPLHWACQESHFDIVGVLMSRNSAVDPVNDLQSTPLHYACREGNLDIVTGLINFNANLEARNKDNLSPLHVAAGMGHIDVTKRLLENGAHMEAEDNALYTPLWRAAYYGHPEVVEVLLAKGANKLARNKKGRKPGDVFSPSVEDPDRKRIKLMLGMGEVQDPPIVAAPAPSLAPTSAASTGSTTASGGREDAANGISTGRGAGGGSGVGRGGGGGGGSVDAVGGNGTLAGSQYGDATAPSTATSALPPPAYKDRQDRVDPAPSAASLADSSYQYPDPSPANSPTSAMLNSSVSTVISEAVVTGALPDGGGAAPTDNVSGGGSEAGGGGGRMGMGNGETLGRGGGKAVASGGSGSGSAVGVRVSPREAAASRTAAGVQTTPSVNGAAEMNRLKSELNGKNDQLQQMALKLEEYKENMLKTQTNNTRDLDHADVQAEEMNQRIIETEKELERKKREVGEVRREIEAATHSADERIAQLEHDLRLARSQSGGCSCTIS